MLTWLAESLVPYFGPLNVFTYQTVRAGSAAFTGFLLCLLFGPFVIRMLTSLKIGQYIRKEHVAALHELHKGKAGTPTMGGALIIGATVLSLLLWGDLDNRLLWVALAVLAALAALGFMDDYTKLRRKQNEGISARAKFAGQIAVGLGLGAYLVFNPITVGAIDVSAFDVRNWQALTAELNAAGRGEASPAVRAVHTLMPQEARAAARAGEERGHLLNDDERALIRGFGAVIKQEALYEAAAWEGVHMPAQLKEMVRQEAPALDSRELRRRNRLLLEAAFPGIIAGSGSDLHTKVGIPGFKNWFIPLGLGYIFFVMFILVSMSNAVNLTDGLDGLAAGVSAISLLAYTGIAYVVSRSDWSHYLYLPYVPEASELFVFGAALLGTGLGFLWFNAHPAEVFMGDTGSLALGGALGTMAVLTKQELLLPIVAGVFVIEAGSVVLQVASYKLLGRRIFRMAPIHHHFELSGWSETKVVMRFYILAMIFVILSLGTLKLR